MSYKITHSYNWYETDRERVIIRTYYISGIAFTFDELPEDLQNDLDIINEASKNLTHTPEYFFLKSFYLIDEEAHPLLFELDLENPEDLPDDTEYEYGNEDLME